MSHFSNAKIRNPYVNGNDSSKSASLTAPMGSSSAMSVEIMVRNLIRSTNATMDSIPSLSSLQAIQEQLNYNRNIQWSLDLALGLGKLILNCTKSFINSSSGCGRTGRNNASSNTEAVIVASLGLLSTVIEDWEDNILYAVLVYDGCENGKSVEDKSSKSLLDTLSELSVLSNNKDNKTKSDDPYSNLRYNAMSCLATAWRCMERLDQYTTLNGNNGGFGNDDPGSPWWITDECTINHLAVVSFQSLYDSFCCDSDGFNLREQFITLSEERRKVSALTIISILLRYQVTSLSTSPVSNVIASTCISGECVIPEAALSQLISKLIKCIQILNHSVLPPSSSEYTLPIAILSMSVVSFMQGLVALSESDSLFHGLDQTILSTGLVENLVHFTFLSTVETNEGSLSIQLPRWNTASSKINITRYLQSFGLQLFSNWSHCGNMAWKKGSEMLLSKLKYIVDPFWYNLLQLDPRQPTVGNNIEAQLPCILWLYLYLRGPARLRLSFVLEKHTEQERSTSTHSARDQNMEHFISTDKGSGKLLQSLFNILRLSSNISDSNRAISSRLLRLLLADKQIISSNDELSRSLWASINQSGVEDYHNTLLEHASTDDANQPLLLSLVDTMDDLLADKKCCSNFIDKLTAQNIESLIYLIKPNTIRYDFTEDAEGEDTDMETPPQNNLSRMDEASICIEHEETKEARGLEHSVRLSVMTVLARMAYHLPTKLYDESTGLLISRISTAVNNSLYEFHNIIGREYEGNSTENWKPLVPSIDQTKRYFRLQNTVAIPENEDFLSKMMFTTTSLRKKRVTQLIDAQKESDQKLYEALEREKKVQEEKDRLLQRVRTHSMTYHRDISRMKLNMTQDTRQLVSIHASERLNAEEHSRQHIQQLEQVNLELERAKTEAQTAKDEHNRIVDQIEELNSNIETLKNEVNHEKSKTNEIMNELQSNRVDIRSYEEKYRHMEKGMHERDDIISQSEDNNHKLQDNLEDLFADMVSLAQIFKQNEDQEESNKQKNYEAAESLNQKLLSECEKNDALNSKMKNMQEENDKLYRKLAKYKERLEQERNDRRHEHEKKKEEDHRKKRNGPVSYLNSLHTSTTSEMSSRNKSYRSRDVSTTDHPPSQRPFHHQSQRSSQRQSHVNSMHEKENKHNPSTSHHSNQRKNKC